MSLLSESLVKFTDGLLLVREDDLDVEAVVLVEEELVVVRFAIFDAAALASCAFRSSLFFFLSFSCSLDALALAETLCSRPDVRGIAIVLGRVMVLFENARMGASRMTGFRAWILIV